MRAKLQEISKELVDDNSFQFKKYKHREETC